MFISEQYEFEMSEVYYDWCRGINASMGFRKATPVILAAFNL